MQPVLGPDPKDVEGDGDNRYLIERGSRSAELLLSAGLYQQLEYLDRTQIAAATSPEERYRAFARDLRLLTSLHGSIVNFGTQTAKPDPLSDDRYVIETADVAVYPEPLCWTTDGFINRLAQEHLADRLWVWSRPQPDLIVFRMTRSPRGLGLAAPPDGADDHPLSGACSLIECP